MQSLELDAEEYFLSGEHVCRHQEGTWNSVFTDQFGEQTYIRYGKAKGGLIGLTLSQEQVSTWVLSQHICNFLSLKMDEIFIKDMNTGSGQHKEEGEARKKLDGEDRSKIREEFSECHHPLKSEAVKVINISNGCVADDKVNVHNAVSVKGWPLNSKMGYQIHFISLCMYKCIQWSR